MADELTNIKRAIKAMGANIQDWAGDSGGSMTCSEVDTVATVLMYGGERDAAINLLRYHAQGDEIEDSHDLRQDVNGTDGLTRDGNEGTMIYPDPDARDGITIGQYVDAL